MLPKVAIASYLDIGDMHCNCIHSYIMIICSLKLCPISSMQLVTILACSYNRGVATNKGDVHLPYHRAVGSNFQWSGQPAAEVCVYSKFRVMSDHKFNSLCEAQSACVVC